MYLSNNQCPATSIVCIQQWLLRDQILLMIFLEFAVGGMDVDEPVLPEEPRGIRVNRMGGSMHIVAVQWTAFNAQG